MSDAVSSTNATGSTYRPGRAGASGARTKLNNRLTILLCLVVFVAPVALGSNRPLSWATWAVVMGAISLVSAIVMARTTERFRIGLDRLRLESMLFAILLFYLVFQQLPLGFSHIPNEPGLDISAAQISVAPGATLLTTLRMLTFGLFTFWFLQAAANGDRRKRILDILLIIVVVHALYALVALFQLGDTILGADKWAYWGSATGTFVNRNSFATFLALGAGLASASLGGVLSSGRRDDRGGSAMLYIVALVILLVTTIATNSRMGLLVWCVAATIPMVALLAKTRIPRAGVGLALAGVTLAAIVILIYFGSTMIERLGGLDQDIGLRTALYTQTQQMVLSRPWTGYGGGAFENAFYLFHQLDLSIDLNWNRAHNTYLGLWAELGLVAGSIPILIIAIIGWRIQSGLSREGGSWTAQAAALSALGAGGIHSLFDFSLEIQANTFLFLAICATGLSASLMRREK